MIRCEIAKLNEDKGKTNLEIKGDSNLLLNELRAIVTALFTGMAEDMPFADAEKLMLNVLDEGMTKGAEKIMGAGEK